MFKSKPLPTKDVRGSLNPVVPFFTALPLLKRNKEANSNGNIIQDEIRPLRNYTSHLIKKGLLIGCNNHLFSYN